MTPHALPFDAVRFITENTAPERPSLVPELAFYTASDALPLWEMTESMLEREGLPPPFWAFAWAGGQAIARHILDHPDVVRGKRVLDVATGGGLVALAALQAGARTVVANEIDVLAGESIALNAKLNGLNHGLVVRIEDMTGDAAPSVDGQPFDVVLAGDVCYERGMAENMTRWLRGLASNGATVLMGDPGRAYVPTSGVHEIARYDVPTDSRLEDRDIRSTAILQLEPA